MNILQSIALLTNTKVLSNLYEPGTTSVRQTKIPRCKISKSESRENSGIIIDLF